MKINDAEKLLGITKANIRFYEKENLLTPTRTEKGYREYSEADILRLKDIIILRKLGIPIQQIQNILDGVLPLQEALDSNILALQEEIEKLNGSLALCQQLKQEDIQALDTERYWTILQNSEQQGYQFKSLLEDYLSFTETGYSWFLWPLPGEDLRNPWKVISFILIFSALYSAVESFLLGVVFLHAFLRHFLMFLLGLILWTAVLLPMYLLSKRKPKLADKLMTALIVVLPITFIAIAIYVIILSYSH